MSLQNNKTILLYGFDKNGDKIIKNIGKEFNIHDFKIIKDNMMGLKIKDILEGSLGGQLEEQDKSYSLDEKVILFNCLTDKQMSGVMKELKVKMDNMPILAVITKTSRNWNFKYLLSHLLQERAWFKKNNRDFN
ncbi:MULTISPECIES: DUF3783 domain-containing protein [Clostridium]|uniref:DUF3783 domain-containing protein n=1 Tax=Clostridium lapidicellarium TaxID=3240931 RepID=A0ABV4DVE0_9CLOT|nr:DUF3783 domain-containing protein [Clostridiales bacterium]